jgi:hypothetical protein
MKGRGFVMFSELGDILTTCALINDHEYRPHSEIMLDMEIFNGPHLVNSPKRVALML